MSNLEVNGNIPENPPSSGSVEDLSEYNNADESTSAPTEILAEFLSSIMMKDYQKALKYCTLSKLAEVKVLNYEPNNATAKEFHPLLLKKLELIKDEEYEYSSSDFSESDTSSSYSSSESSSSECYE